MTVNAHRIETVVAANGTLTLRDLPFKPGTSLEIIVLERAAPTPSQAADQEHVGDWLQASLPSLQEVWDNDEDAIYDSL